MRYFTSETNNPDICIAEGINLKNQFTDFWNEATSRMALSHCFTMCHGLRAVFYHSLFTVATLISALETSFPSTEAVTWNTHMLSLLATYSASMIN